MVNSSDLIPEVSRETCNCKANWRFLASMAFFSNVVDRIKWIENQNQFSTCCDRKRGVLNRTKGGQTFDNIHQFVDHTRGDGLAIQAIKQHIQSALCVIHQPLLICLVVEFGYAFGKKKNSEVVNFHCFHCGTRKSLLTGSPCFIWFINRWRLTKIGLLASGIWLRSPGAAKEGAYDALRS